MTASTYSSKKTLRVFMAVAASALACGSAIAQWQWIDATGRKVYSDTAPPRTVPDKNILKRPRVVAPVAAQESPAPAETAAGAAPVPAPQPTAVDAKLEAKRIEAEKAEAARKKVEEDKRNQARAENCERAKRSLATLNSGIRVRTTNANGESEVMDDAARAAEARRVENIVSNDCGTGKAPVVRQGANSVP